MSLSSRKASVTLLHKGEGPSLFTVRSQQLQLTEQPSYAHNFPPKPFHSPTSIAKRKQHNTVVRCVDRQEANAMFAKRIKDRTARHFRPSSSTKLPPTGDKPGRGHQCELYLRERLFASNQNRPANFPPPSFMPRWNPRHRNRTYISRMVMEDPWSLPPDQRLELTKRTGLRLKTLTKQYQYKLGAFLTYGKGAGPTQCQCHVTFCDHCNKKHVDRCPLHKQLLRDVDANVKDIREEFCPLTKNVEDLPLEEIADPALYVAEVVRRLRAGEITEPPPLPPRIFQSTDKYWKPAKRATASNDASLEALSAKKVATTESTAQTELVVIDKDMQAEVRRGCSQTPDPSRDQPFLTSILCKPREPKGYYRQIVPTSSSGDQVEPKDLIRFKDLARRIVPTMARDIVRQALSEVSDEARLHEVRSFRCTYMQQLWDSQRSEQFKGMTEKWKSSACVEEQAKLDQETRLEREAEACLGAVAFAQSYLHNFPGRVMESLKRQGQLYNEDLLAINTCFIPDVNVAARKRAFRRQRSNTILDDMINNAIHNLGMELNRGEVVDERYLKPEFWMTKPLREVLPTREDTSVPVEDLMERLWDSGWCIDTNGWLLSSEDVNAEDQETDVERFLDNVRVKFDEFERPTNLVDRRGEAIPIDVEWEVEMKSKLSVFAKPSLKTPERFRIKVTQAVKLSLEEVEQETEETGSKKSEEVTITIHPVDDNDDELKTILHKRSVFGSFNADPDDDVDT